jgi:citrate lyase gamma subunit
VVVLARVVRELLAKFSVLPVKVKVNRAVALDQILAAGNDDQGSFSAPQWNVDETSAE